jgi:hypothetical protein
MTSRTQGMIEWLVQNGYSPEIDPKAIQRFIDTTFKQESTDQGDTAQAAVLLAALAEGTKTGDDMNVELRQILHLRKNSAGKFNFDPKKAYPGSLAYDIVNRHLCGEIKRVEAVEEFVSKLFKHETDPPDSRTIERWIDVMKPRIKKDIERLERGREFLERLGEDQTNSTDK